MQVWLTYHQFSDYVSTVSDFGIKTFTYACYESISVEINEKTNHVLIINADSSFVPPLVYAMLGSSRDLAVGTVAVASLLISSLLGKEVNPNENPKLYLQLAFTATFFAGLFQASLGFLRSASLMISRALYMLDAFLF